MLRQNLRIFQARFLCIINLLYPCRSSYLGFLGYGEVDYGASNLRIKVVTITQQLPGSIFSPNDSVSEVLKLSSYMNLSGCHGVRSAMNNRILDQSQSIFARNITRPFILVVVSLPKMVVDI